MAEKARQFQPMFGYRSDLQERKSRETTFLLWPSSAPKSVETAGLVAAGFYYVGDDDKVACYSCHIKVENWKDGDVPVEVHRKQSPDCRHLLTMSQQDGDRWLDKHRQTLVSTGARRKEPANSGPVVPATSNYSGKNHLPFPSADSSGSTNDHAVSGMRSRLAKETAASCSPVSATSPTPGHHSNQRDMQHEEDRLLTYIDHCPEEVVRQKTTLANAGFFYTGCGGVIQCAFCNGEIHFKKIGSQPVENHAKFFPTCQFAMQRLPFRTAPVEDGCETANIETDAKRQNHAVGRCKNQPDEKSHLTTDGRIVFGDFLCSKRLILLLVNFVQEASIFLNLVEQLF